MAISDRGELWLGAITEITVFYAERITDNATKETANVYPSGSQHVLVNGRIAIDAGKRTGEDADLVVRAT